MAETTKLRIKWNYPLCGGGEAHYYAEKQKEKIPPAVVCLPSLCA